MRKHDGTTKWLQDYSSKVVRISLKPIETTYREYFKDREIGGELNRKLPRFHGKYATAPSFPIDYQSAKVAGDSLCVQKIGWMKLVGNNPYPDSEFKSGRIRYECGKWYAYLTYEVQAEASLPHSIREVGIDRNIAEGRLAVLSDGTKHSGPNLERKVARRKRYQRKMARQVKGSNRRNVTKVRLQRAFQEERFARLNWAHHVSKDVASEYDVRLRGEAEHPGHDKIGQGNEAETRQEREGKSGPEPSDTGQRVGHAGIVPEL